MNCKGTAIIAVTFPQGVGRVFVVEYPNYFTVLCRIIPVSSPLPPPPDIDAEVVKTDDPRKVLVYGTGASNYMLQIRKALEGYYSVKGKLNSLTSKPSA